MPDTVRDQFIDALLPCSYAGVPFLFSGGTVVGGVRGTPRPILNSDAQIVSIVGGRQRSYSMRGYIAARESVGPDGSATVVQNYAAHRSALVAAFEAKRADVFVHPIEGAITGLVALNYSIEETPDEWGLGRVTVELVRDTRSVTPAPAVGAAPAVLAAAETAKASFLEGLAERWGVDPAIVGSYEDGLTKARAAFESMQEIANEAELLTDGVDRVAAVVSEGVAAAARIITTPQTLATQIGGAVAVLVSAFPTALVAFDGMVRGFTFGDLDFAIDLSAPSAGNRKRNADSMNVTMKALYLAEAYRFATGLEFLTLDEIDAAEAKLNAQFGAVVGSGAASAESVGTLEDLRSQFGLYLDRARLSARRVTTTRTHPVTPRVLAHALYESDALAGVLAALNGAYSFDLVEGDVSVLTA